MYNGTVTVLGPNTGLKVIDLKITDSFPLLALPGRARLLLPGGTTEEISDYQHLSIPPDLRLHLTPRRGTDQPHRYFPGITDARSRKLVRPIVRAFTYVSAPVDRHRPFKGKWEGGSVIISPLADAEYAPAVTRLFLDLLVHLEPYAPTLQDVPFAAAAMRPAPDRTDYRLGPYRFGVLQRRSPALDVYFTLRWGFWVAEGDGGYLIPPDTEGR